MEKSIIIIGGGLSGLATGCYARMNGFRASVFEMHDKAGGVCTAWKRKGYTIDGAMNWLVGTKPGGVFSRYWEELGAAPEWKIYNHDLLLIYEDKVHAPFTLFCDADRLEEYLLEIAPEDERLIKDLTRAVRSLRIEMPTEKPSELTTILDKAVYLKALPLAGMMAKYSKITVKKYAEGMKNPYLRELFPRAFGEDMPMTMPLMLLSLQHHKTAGHVIGGALALVDLIQRRYASLGGELHLSAKVTKILVENDRAVGIGLADGTEHRADYVVSTADGRTVIFDMLGGRYADEKLRRRYEHPNLFEPLVYVALGVNRSFDDVPSSLLGLSYPLDSPIVIAGTEHKKMNVHIYDFDPTLSPPGKNLVVVQFGTDWDRWEKLRQDITCYRTEKERIADQVIRGLCQRFPGIDAQVEMRDVATPITWERYTGNWRGSYEGWMFEGSSFLSSMSKTLPGLDGFYMAGQWVNPGGGMPTAAMSGNHTIQLICRREKRKFVTSKPRE